MENKNFKMEICVVAEMNGDKTDIQIILPKNQSDYTLSTMAHVLCSGISLIVRSVHETGEKSEADMLKEVIMHLESEFTCPKSFNDVLVHDKYKKK